MAPSMMRDLSIQDRRRKLGRGQPIDVMRAQTREFVSRLRQRPAQRLNAGKTA